MILMADQAAVTEDNGDSDDGGGPAPEDGEVSIDAIDDSELLEEHLREIANEYKPAIKYNSLQAAVDAWLQKYPSGTKSLEILNVNTGVVEAAYQASRQMGPRSIYKLFYLYDAYAQVDAGQDDPTQPYAGQTLATCLDVIVRYSNNPCAEAMYDDPARSARVAQLIAKLGLANTRADGLVTSAQDVVKLLQYYYRHPEWSENSWQKFRETALNQPYNYRKGLPSGFEVARVYDKAGWGGAVYNDAAMVELSDGRRYVVVVLTDGIGYAALRDLGVMLERTML